MNSINSVSYLNYMRGIRRVLHSHPEPSFLEYNTQRLIAGELDKLAIPYRKVLTGLIADIAGRDTKSAVTAFRADTDALLLTEENQIEYRSQVPGVMHACGHDGHIACLLGFAKYLSCHRPERNVRLIFQPAEEGEGGALSMIEGGALQNVEKIYALHVDPCLDTGVVGVNAGAVMAGVVEFDVQFAGRSAHAAENKLGIDALRAAHCFLNGFYREAEGLNASRLLLHCGRITSGSARNIVANHAVLNCTFRYFDSAEKQAIISRLHALVGDTDSKFGTEGKLTVQAEYIPVVNAPKPAAEVSAAAQSAEGCTVIPDKPRFTAEDFAFYADKVPGALFWLGVNSGENVLLHTPDFDFKEEALLNGLQIFINLLH